MKLAIIGCGNIAGPYTKDIARHPELEILGFSDMDPARAEAFASEHGGRAYGSLEDVLADPAVDAVVNLTIHHAHREVVGRALEAGKHVYSEKPLSMTYREARELVELAAGRGLRLACAPITFLGEAQQTALKLVREGKLGPVRAVYAEVNHGRIESWHPAPVPFYEVGPLFDVGVYPLTVLTAIFGPAKRVTAYGTVLKPDRVTKAGQAFRLETPDYYVANLEFEGGPVVRLSANFYVTSKSKGGEGIEFHGDIGSLHLADWFSPGSRLEYVEFVGPDKLYESVPLAREASGFDWARGLGDFAEAIEEGRPSRVTGEQAAHIVEIMEATGQSVRSGGPVELHSTFTPPAPMDWAR